MTAPMVERLEDRCTPSPLLGQRAQEARTLRWLQSMDADCLWMVIARHPSPAVRALAIQVIMPQLAAESLAQTAAVSALWAAQGDS
jgi:hypothetical protein